MSSKPLLMRKLGQRHAAIKAHACRGALVLGSFIAGAMLGTVGFLHWQFWSMLLPIAVIIGLAIAPAAYAPIPLARRGRR